MKQAMVWALVVLLSIPALPLWAQRGAGQANQGRDNPATCTNAAALAELQPLSPEEESWLLTMREEEKLARDVYLTLFETWGLSIFDRISLSEQRHFDALGRAIARYGLIDPVAGAPTGAFSSPRFKDLYAGLVLEGSASIAAALHVGAKIEELDILDLEEALKITDNPDLVKVYANLLQGSKNHLRAFVSHLQIVGEAYVPQYIDAGAFALILDGARGKGRAHAGGFGFSRKK